MTTDSESLRLASDGLKGYQRWLDDLFEGLDRVMSEALQVAGDGSLDSMFDELRRSRERVRMVETDLATTAMRLDEAAEAAEQFERRR